MRRPSEPLNLDATRTPKQNLKRTEQYLWLDAESTYLLHSLDLPPVADVTGRAGQVTVDALGLPK